MPAVENIYPDLVEMAGLNAVIARARQKLIEAKPEAAMLLAEAALAAAPNAEAAIMISIDATTALRERSGGENFWEDGWLASRIELLQQRRQQ